MGRKTERIQRSTIYKALFYSLIVIVLCFIITPTKVSAADPEILTIHSVLVTRNLAWVDDMLITIHYEVDWSDHDDRPADGSNASDNFIIQLVGQESDETIGSILPYVFTNSGYGQNIASFYYIAGDGLVWGGSYSVRLSSQPDYISPPISWVWTISEPDYSPRILSDDNQEYLKNWLVGVVQSIESDWDVSDSLVISATTYVLTATGESYINRVIPGIRTLCPGIITTETSDATYTDETFATTQQDRLVSQWDGSGIWVEDAITGAEDMFGGRHIFWNALIVITMLILGCLSYMYFKNGLVGFSLGFFVMFFATALGLFEPLYMAGILFLMLFISVWQVTLKNAS